MGDMVDRDAATKIIALCSAESDSPNAHYVCKEAIKRIAALPAASAEDIGTLRDRLARIGLAFENVDAQVSDGGAFTERSWEQLRAAITDGDEHG